MLECMQKQAKSFQSGHSLTAALAVPLAASLQLSVGRNPVAMQMHWKRTVVVFHFHLTDLFLNFSQHCLFAAVDLSFSPS